MASQHTEPPAASPVGVLVVDGGWVFRRVARAVVDATVGFEVVGEATSPREALAAVEDLLPDLVLIEVRLWGFGGIETARRVAERHPEAVVVLMSVDDPLRLPGEVGLCGAADLVRKQELRPTVLRELWRLHQPA